MGAYGEARQQGGAEFGAGTCPSLVGAAWCDVAGHPTRRRPGGGEGARGRGKGLGPRAARADPPASISTPVHDGSRRGITQPAALPRSTTCHANCCSCPRLILSTVFSDALLALTCLELTISNHTCASPHRTPFPSLLLFRSLFPPLSYLTFPRATTT